MSSNPQMLPTTALGYYQQHEHKLGTTSLFQANVIDTVYSCILLRYPLFQELYLYQKYKEDPWVKQTHLFHL